MSDWLDGIAALLGLNKGAFLTGFIGSLLSFRYVSELGTFGLPVAFAGGAIGAGFLAEPLADEFLMGRYVGAVGFVIGAVGMSVLAAVLEAIKKADFWGLVKSKFGGDR